MRISLRLVILLMLGVEFVALLFAYCQVRAERRALRNDLLAEVESEAGRINWRFQKGNWRPIVFLKRHHTHRKIDQYYRAAVGCGLDQRALCDSSRPTGTG